ncbi:DNA mismatch endonuclease Vsr [Bradyrhizobium sp. Arg68]|uniref:very short patch repair endonuclease n=1 Tax=Bradyrhizobium ivorense TaxID=2511166 RepID=UPI001E4CD938|nr:very short patch repair endonuclease [Bradyrhizobium ivorense]MCC8939088.1 DNA mismatch endonuclease Vsr [Bradyrhizobium ivorense]
MADHLTREQRSRNMSAVRNKNTGPEILARKAAHRLGLRFRLHRTDLPGSPDFVLPKYSTAVFVHGCFWHAHGCRRSKLPESNIEFWANKIGKNRERDRKARSALGRLGWRVVTLWQCELPDLQTAKKRIASVVIQKAKQERKIRRLAGVGRGGRKSPSS